MGSIFDRMAQGPGGLQQSDYNEWNQMVGSAPPDRFHQAATQAIQQVPHEEYSQHVQPGVGGTDPLGSLQPNQRSSIAQSLIGALTGSGMSPSQIQQNTNVQSLDPRQMSPQDLASMLQWTKQNNPNALGNVATQYQNQPDMLSSILSNKALMGIAIGLGAKYLSDRAKSQNQGNQPTSHQKPF